LPGVLKPTCEIAAVWPVKDLVRTRVVESTTSTVLQKPPQTSRLPSSLKAREYTPPLPSAVTRASPTTPAKKEEEEEDEDEKEEEVRERRSTLERATRPSAKAVASRGDVGDSATSRTPGENPR
jgi:hypothetical protein